MAASVLAFLQTTTGLLVALASLLAALGAIVGLVVKFVGTRSRLKQIETTLAVLVKQVESFKRQQLVNRTSERVLAKVEGRPSVHDMAEADDLEELRAEVAALRAKQEDELRRLDVAFKGIETTLGHIVNGRMKLQ